MILVPIAAVLISFARGRNDTEQHNKTKILLQIKGRSIGAVALFLAIASAVIVIIVFRLTMLGRNEKLLLWMSLPPALIAVIIGNYLLDRYNDSTIQASWFARWAGILAIMDIGGFNALFLIYFTSSKEMTKAVHPSQEQLTVVSYVILSVVFLLIICGLGWCFYRALSMAGKDTEIQYPDGVGEEGQQG
jgi:hypothetical protein